MQPEFPRGAIAAQAAELGGMTAEKALRLTIKMIAAEVTLRDLPAVCGGIGIGALRTNAPMFG